MNLTELLFPIPPSDFLAAYYTQRALHIPGSEDKFGHLFNYNEFNRVLNSGRSPLPTLKLAKHGELLPVEDSIGILKALQMGATLIIDDIDTYSPDLRDTLAIVSKDIGEPLQANLYFSQPDNLGYKLHYDTHDVFILQIVGYKTWRIFEPTVQYPMWVQKEHPRDTPTKPYVEIEVKPGDLLYIPRGHWHEATAHHEASLHITVGINARTGIDYLLWLANELRTDVAFREDFLPPSARSIDAALGDPALSSKLDTLKSKLATAFDSATMLRAYQIYCRALTRKSFSYDLPIQLLARPTPFADDDVFLRSCGQQASLSDVPDERALELAVEERLYKFDPQVKPLLNALFASTHITYRQLMQSSILSPRQAEEVLNLLVRDGVIRRSNSNSL